MGNKPWIWTIVIILLVILVLRVASAPPKDPISGKIKCKDGDVSFSHWFFYGCGKNWWRNTNTVSPTTTNVNQTIIIPGNVNPSPRPYPIPPIRCNTDMRGYDINNKLNPACGQAPCNPSRKGYDIYGRVNTGCGIISPGLTVIM